MKIKSIFCAILSVMMLLTGMALAEQANDTAAPFYGVYHSEDGFSRLAIMPTGTPGTAEAEVTLYRLADITFTMAYAATTEQGALIGNAAGDDGLNLGIAIELTETGATVRFVSSQWDLIPVGSEYQFITGAMPVSGEVFTALFDNALTGYAGTAGSSLKSAAGACQLLETLVYADAGYWPEGSLSEVLASAVASLTAEKQSELKTNMNSTVIPLINQALTDLTSLSGQLTDAEVYDAMSELVADPLAAADWFAFTQAWNAVQSN